MCIVYDARRTCQVNAGHAEPLGRRVPARRCILQPVNRRGRVRGLAAWTDRPQLSASLKGGWLSARAGLPADAPARHDRQTKEFLPRMSEDPNYVALLNDLCKRNPLIT